MLSTQDFIRMLANEQNIVKLQTDGLTQADPLIQPQPSGTCMNWVLGHLVDNLITMLALLGEDNPVPEAYLARYKRESEPVRGDEPGVLQVGQLLGYYNKAHDRLITKLSGTPDDFFHREVQAGGRVVTLGYRFLFLFFHHTYHIGQLELLRQLAGKTEKII